jgi:hypothetical protein
VSVSKRSAEQTLGVPRREKQGLDITSYQVRYLEQQALRNPIKAKNFFDTRIF